MLGTGMPGEEGNAWELDGAGQKDLGRVAACECMRGRGRGDHGLQEKDVARGVGDV